MTVFLRRYIVVENILIARIPTADSGIAKVSPVTISLII